MTPPLWPHPSPRGSYIISIEYLHHLRMLPQLFWPKGFWKDFKKIPISKIPMLKFDTPPPFVATLYSQGLWFEQTWNYLTWVHRNLKLFWPTSFSEDLKKNQITSTNFQKVLIISFWKRTWPLILPNLNPISPIIFCDNFWYISSLHSLKKRNICN